MVSFKVWRVPGCGCYLPLLPPERSAGRRRRAASTVEAAGRPGMFTEEDGTQAEGAMLRDASVS